MLVPLRFDSLRAHSREASHSLVDKSFSPMGNSADGLLTLRKALEPTDMIRLIKGVIVWLCLVCAAITCRAADRDETQLITAEGTVELLRANSADWAPARVGVTLQLNDRLRTAQKSRATIRLFDSGIVRLGESSTFQLTAPNGDSSRPLLDIKTGSLYFFSREKPNDVRFKTPTISGALRGTEVAVTVGESGTTDVGLIDGQVNLMAAGTELNLVSGERATTSDGNDLKKVPLINAQNVIQWVLYYPAVLNPSDLDLSADESKEIEPSLQAYTSGDLIKASGLFAMPANPSESLLLYAAALDLAVGNVAHAANVVAEHSVSSVGRALSDLIAAVQFREINPQTPSSASEWLGYSYYLQSRGQLTAAREAATQATQLAPEFGFGWTRLAELEFAHGRIDSARRALERSLELSPDNAQAHALEGFILSAQYKKKNALIAFDKAIELNGSLGSAWLGRGLLKIKSGDVEAGRQDLQTAAALEPQRSVYRAYLAKAFATENRFNLAEKDLRLAKALDESDPTAWLYSGLIEQQQNRINSAIRDLQKSVELNNNRQIYRSEYLLDQDRATKGANLASIYRDANMLPAGLSEAQRSVTYDYGNYAAHLYLAQSYDLLRDPKKFNLRYETARLSELYLTDLLSPVGGYNLSQNVGQQDAQRMFERNRLGVSSETEYFSNGAWSETGSQFGTFNGTAYSIDAFYRSDRGQQVNNDIEQRTISGQFKQQLTFKDSIYLQALSYDATSGDIAQRYDPASADPDIRVHEEHQPDIFVGYHREWNPGIHTLAFVGRSDLTLDLDDPSFAPPFFRRRNGEYTLIQNAPLHMLDYSREYELYSGEIQQVFQTARQNFIFGMRYQSAETTTSSQISDVFDQPTTNQNQDNNFNRFTAYGYYQWQVWDPFHLTAGLAYDQIHYPRNVDTSPVSTEETSKDRVLPKVGAVYTPWCNGTFRAAYTRSLGGFSLDNSIRLEPTQVGGFNQAYRSLIPESAGGVAYGEDFETFSLGYDHSFHTGTFVGLELEDLNSNADRSQGILTSSGFLPIPNLGTNALERLDFEERALRFYAYQLVGRDLVFGANYRLSHARLDTHFPEVPSSVEGSSQNQEATLHELTLSATYNHPCGFFAQAEGTYYSQSNHNDFPGPGDDFWQENVFVGYRFRKRFAEARVGILNIADRDYRLNPLNLHPELYRARTFTARLRINL